MFAQRKTLALWSEYQIEILQFTNIQYRQTKPPSSLQSVTQPPSLINCCTCRSDQTNTHVIILLSEFMSIIGQSIYPHHCLITCVTCHAICNWHHRCWWLCNTDSRTRTGHDMSGLFMFNAIYSTKWSSQLIFFCLTQISGDCGPRPRNALNILESKCCVS